MMSKDSGDHNKQLNVDVKLLKAVYDQYNTFYNVNPQTGNATLKDKAKEQGVTDVNSLREYLTQNLGAKGEFQGKNTEIISALGAVQFNNQVQFFLQNPNTEGKEGPLGEMIVQRAWEANLNDLAKPITQDPLKQKTSAQGVLDALTAKELTLAQVKILNNEIVENPASPERVEKMISGMGSRMEKATPAIEKQANETIEKARGKLLEQKNSATRKTMSEGRPEHKQLQKRERTSSLDPKQLARLRENYNTHEKSGEESQQDTTERSASTGKLPNRLVRSERSSSFDPEKLSQLREKHNTPNNGKTSTQNLAQALGAEGKNLGQSLQASGVIIKGSASMEEGAVSPEAAKNPQKTKGSQEPQK